MSNTSNYIVYTMINNCRVSVEVSCNEPQEAIDMVTELLKDIPEEKVGQLRVCDSATGFFIRGFS